MKSRGALRGHERYLIVNADDFGRSPGVNRGVMRAHEEGIVTSASLMVRWPATSEAVVYARANPRLSLGLHVDLGEWAYHRRWVPVYEVVSTGDEGAVTAEVARQLEAFRRLAGRDPTHLDSHQHVHETAGVASVLTELARQLSVPLRNRSPLVRHCGAFYGQTGKGAPVHEGITVEALIAVLATLSPGVTELACHPGVAMESVTTYAREREKEVETLCDPRVRAALAAHRIELCSFVHLPNEAGAG